MNVKGICPVGRIVTFLLLLLLMKNVFCCLVGKVLLITSVNLLHARQATKRWTVFVLIKEIFNITSMVISDFDVSIVVFYLYY